MLRATSVGELVRSLGESGARGSVGRLFRSSAYLESKEGLVLLLRGELRSPMTVNLPPGPEFTRSLSAQQQFRLGRDRLVIGELEILLGSAKTFTSSLMKGQPAEPISGTELVKGAVALKLLYSASESALGLVRGEGFRTFADSVLRPLARGEENQLYRLDSYAGLIGGGTGFTPAGDDLVGGFTAAFNHYASVTGREPISLPLSELRKRTVRESATLVDYAQRGYVDEGMERLILSGLGGRPAQFRASLAELASRGHTSGLDMSLGVLLLVASVNDLIGREKALESSLRAIGN